MSIRTYLDFELQFEQIDDATYRARVFNSPAGQAETTFFLPFSEQEIEIFFLRVSRPRRSVRRINSPEMTEVRRIGGKLYEALFQGSVQDCLLRSIDKAEQQNKGLRLRLHLPTSLIELPWEYLYDAERDHFFSHSVSTPIVRYVDLQQAIRPLVVTRPLKVLVMISSPSDFEPLNIEGEWNKINDATGEAKLHGQIQLTRLPRATLDALQKQLRREQYHIFHFIGHGAFDDRNHDGVLLLEDDDGHSREVSGNYLSTLLHDHPSLRLALLNACEGARTSQSDPFAGVAQQLLRQGIPAVIAMQFEISDEAAVILTKAFYEALADGYPVDGALAEARKSLYTAGNDIEWGTPVLYLRAEDGRLFDLAIQAGNDVLVPDEKAADEKGILEPLLAEEPSVTQTITRPVSVNRPQRGYIALTVAILLLLVAVLSIWEIDWFTRTASQETPIFSTEVTQPSPQHSDGASSIGAIDPISRTLWLQEGYDVMNEGDYGEAAKAFERILEANSEDVDALLGLGKALRFAGDRDKALRTLSRAVKIAPDSPAVNSAMGELYYEQFNDPQQALEYLSRALDAISPESQRAETYLVRAMCYQALGDYERSIADWDEVIRLQPDNSDNYLGRAQIHQLVDDEESAEDDFNMAINLSPTTGWYYFARADFLVQSDREDEAATDYASFLHYRDPDESEDLVNKAERFVALHSATPTP